MYFDYFWRDDENRKFFENWKDSYADSSIEEYLIYFDHFWRDDFPQLMKGSYPDSISNLRNEMLRKTSYVNFDLNNPYKILSDVAKPKDCSEYGNSS